MIIEKIEKTTWLTVSFLRLTSFFLTGGFPFFFFCAMISLSVRNLTGLFYYIISDLEGGLEN
jgi:hypothetical protein